MKTIVVTGASGLVARHLIYELSKNEDYQIVAVSRQPEKTAELYVGMPVKCITYNNVADFLTGAILIHCAFTRNNDGKSVVDSLDVAQKIFISAFKNNVSAVINISSRSVYVEPNEGSLNTEDSALNYAPYISLGKIIEERMVIDLFEGTDILFTNLRLASVNELKRDNTMIRPLNVFVSNVIAGKPIRVIGGMQMMSFIDPRDIATAICSLLKIAQWRPIYNVGTGWMCTRSLLEMAKLVVSKGKQLGYKEVLINVEEKNVIQRAGLDISQITEDTGWLPTISIELMIESLYQMLGKE